MTGDEQAGDGSEEDKMELALYLFHERAGIGEYGGGLTRSDAEEMALKQVRREVGGKYADAIEADLIKQQNVTNKQEKQHE